MRTYQTLLAIAGTLLFGVLLLADLRQANFENRSERRLAVDSAVDGSHPAIAGLDHDLKRFTADSPYMRNERY